MNLFIQHKTQDEQPKESNWYPTDRGLLYYFKEDEHWSCRDDRLSVEYPWLWYEKVEYGCTSKAVKEGYRHCNICSGENCKNWGIIKK